MSDAMNSIHHQESTDFDFLPMSNFIDLQMTLQTINQKVCHELKMKA